MRDGYDSCQATTRPPPFYFLILTSQFVGKSAGLPVDGKRSAPHFQRSAFVSRKGCASQLQQSPDRQRRSPVPCRQSRPRQPRPSSRPRRQSTSSRSTGNGSHQIVGRRTLSDTEETGYWLELLSEAGIATGDELTAIFVTILKRSKRKTFLIFSFILLPF